MAKICTISDESDTSGDETVRVEANQGATESRPKHELSVRKTSRAELMPRFRNLSINEDDFQEATDGKSEAGDGDPFRPRSRSAPPAFWAAKKYGRELRRMSDEFDKGVVDKGMRKVRSAGTASQMRTSRSWFTYLWSHQESDSETMSSLTTQNTRPAE